MTILVTGGAGYIGSHVVRLLRERGDDVVVVDDLSGGKAERLGDVPLEQIDLVSDEAPAQIQEVIGRHRVDSAVHFAARKQVAESVARPAWYAQQNVGGLANLLLALEAGGVDRLVYSSSAAVYGTTEGPAIGEDSPTAPVNPYGRTKLIGEQLLHDAVEPLGMRAASLRYFNVAGAGWDDLGDTAVLNLVPMVFERIDAGLPPLIFGDDYATADGTCVRDYVHVLDLADAHLAVLDALRDRPPGAAVYNVGTGTGTSVREMVDAIRQVAGFDITAEVRPRRVGDPAVVVANPARIESELGWRATRDVSDIVVSAWSSHESHRGAGSAG